jgi:hypothetical protein
MTESEVQDIRKSDTDALDASKASGVVTVGLVPSPGQCQRVAADIEAGLPGFLSENVDDGVSWEIKIVADPLTGSDVETPRLLDEIASWRQEHDWDYAICLTDLPVHDGGRVVIAAASVERGLAWVSIPPLGVFHLRHRARAMIVELLDEIRWGTPRGEAEPREHRRQTDKQKIGSGIAREVAPPGDDRDVDVRYEARRLTGYARLLAGMVYANRPWRLFPSFKATIATAFATGGYGLIFSTLWKLGNIYEIWRLVLLMIVAMAILIVWIILAHGLWQRHRQASSSYLVTLYNSATLLTITAGVVFAYALVLLLLFLAALVYIPTPMLESTIQQPVTPMTFVRIAWITASVATIAGAVGAGLENTEAVREATFGWRQHHRLEEYEKAWGDQQNREAR